jgi:peptidyl-prolyl cis-trans isomerase D
MLRFLRRNARSWIMYIIVGIIIFVFVLYFGSSKDSSRARAIATVDNVAISESDFHEEYSKLMDMVKQRYGAKLTPEDLKKMDLKEKAFDSLLTRQIIIAKAADLKVQVSDEELRKMIMTVPALQTNGVFDERKYQQLLRYNKTSAEDFEKMQKIDLTANKIESLIRDGIKISDREVLDAYTMQNQKINVDYIQVSQTDINKKITPTDAELESYLKNNGSRFRIATQLKVKYLFFDADDFAPSNISDSDIRDYYNRNKEKYKAKGDKQMQLDEARSLVLKELRKTRGLQGAFTEAKRAHDTIYQEDNFEAYAAKNKLKIKIMDFFQVNKPPQEFASVKNLAALLTDLQKKDISKVMSADDGYYLLQVIDKKDAYLPRLAEIRKEVEKYFVEHEKQVFAEQEAANILARLKKGEDLGKVAKDKGLKISETGFFHPGAGIPKLGLSPDSTEALVQLTEHKPYPEKPFLINGAYVVFKFKEASKVDLKDFEAKKDTYKNIFASLKREEILRTWLEGNKEAMKKEGRLKIKKEAKDL